MEEFARLFSSLLALVYHCFDRIVILGHLPLLTRPENIVHFFRDVHGVGAITKEVLRQRTTEYHQWVEAFARNHHIPIEWAEKGVRKEDYVRPRLRQMERRQRCGVYFHPQEHGGWRQLPGRCPSIRPSIRITALCPNSARATPITTSTSATRCWGPSRCASVRSCRSRLPTISMVIISSNSNCAVQGSSSTKTITPFCPWPTPGHSKPLPMPSAPSSFAPGWITGP